MANTQHTRSLPTPPVSLPAYEPPTPPSSSPKPPVDSNSVESFKFSVPSPLYDKNAPYPGDTSFVENTLRAENTPQAESPSYTKNAPVRMSAAQQLYASSFANRGLTTATLPPPTIDAPRRSAREQPSFYKNQVSSYVQHPAPKARLPDSARPSTLPNNNARSTSSPAHVRSMGPRAPTYSGNSVPDRSPRSTPNAPNMSLSSNSSSYLRGHAELDRPMITTDMPNFNRASAYTRPQETRNLFPPTHVETVKPRELRNVTTAMKPPSGFVAPQSITSNVERPPPASAPLPPLPTSGQTHYLPIIASPPPPAPAPLSPLQTDGRIHSLPVIVSPLPLPPPPPVNVFQQSQPQHPAAPYSPNYLQPNMLTQQTPNTSSAISLSQATGTYRNRASRLMNGITSLANSLGQLAVRSSAQSLLSGSSVEETIEENAGDSVGAEFLNFLGTDASGSVTASGDSVGVDYDGGGYSEDLSTSMVLGPQFDTSYEQDPSTSFSVTLPRFSVASGGTQYTPHTVNNTMGHAYMRQSHLPVGAQQPYSQAPQQPVYNPY